MNTDQLADALNGLLNASQCTARSLNQFAEAFQRALEAERRKSSPLLAQHRHRRHK